jgi:hypothetical protein
MLPFSNHRRNESVARDSVPPQIKSHDRRAGRNPAPHFNIPMKLHAFLLASLFLATAPFSAAETPASRQPPAGRQVRIVAEFIEVSQEQLTELLFAPKTTPDDSALRKQLAELVKQGKAKVVETLVAQSTAGQSGTTESIEELIYPTEYEPAETPNEVEISGEPEKSSGEAELLTPPTPTAFETRNLGSTFEWKASVDKDGRRVHLNFAPEIVWHVGNTVWGEWKDKHGETNIQMPRMFTMRLNLSVSVISGQPTLVAALSPKDEQGHIDRSRKWIVFVRCDILE